MIDEIVCSLSGITPAEETILFDPPKQSEYLPVGWIKVTIERKYPNPEWIKLQNLKRALLQTALQQVPEEHREAQLPNIEMQLEAQYVHLEAKDKYKMTTVDKEVVFISPPEADEDIMEEYERLMELLGIELEDDEEEGVALDDGQDQQLSAAPKTETEIKEEVSGSQETDTAEEN